MKSNYLFHYTDLNALISIVSDNSMRASHIQYLNDTTERRVLVEAVHEHVENLIWRRGTDKPDERLADQMAKWSAKLWNPEPVFVTCFSGGEPGETWVDLLSQWRGYGGKPGVCLVFDGNTLAAHCRATKFLELVKVEYADPTNEDDPVLKSAVEKAFRGFLPAFVEKAGVAIKHIAFREENEWRLVVPDRPSRASEVIRKSGYRVRGSLLVPYLDVKLPLAELLAGVIVGPIAHNGLTAEAIRRMLKEKGYAAAEKVHVTNIPYRGFE